MATYLTLPADLPNHEQGFKPDEDVHHQIHTIAQHWLSQVEIASVTNDGDLFASLFVKNGFWRDILAFTNDYRSIRSGNIAKAAKARFPLVKARDFTFAAKEPALEHPFPDVSFLSIHFDFQTETGPAYGVANLVYQDKQWKAFTVFTLLEGIHDHKQKVGANRERGTHNAKLSYDDRRAEEREFANSSPDVLIVGGGHNGLAAAAQLNTLGVSNLVIDTYKRVGDNWRLRYRSLSLHDPVYANHLPFYPFPENWPIFTPAGKLANFLESYVDVLEINVWTESTLDPVKTKFNESTKKWDVVIHRTHISGKKETREFSVSHVVLATGLGGGKPKMPAPFPGQNEWAGRVVHSSKHTSGADWTGKKALVVGACTSAHDLCVDFAKNGADVTMLQRSPTYVMSVDKGMAMLVSGLYGPHAPSTDLSDRIAESNPKIIAKLFHKRLIPQLAEQDKEMLDGLKKAGFNSWLGPENAGFLMMALEKAGGYYFSTGGSEMIINGDIKVKQGEIASFDPKSEITFKDGSKEKYDVVVFATGYTGFPDTIRATVGEQYAETFNPVWGLDEEGEIRGVCRESNIPNLFFIVGNLSACRLSSKTLALQILAQREGIFGERYTYAKQNADGDIDDKMVFKAINGLNGHLQPVEDKV
ncbi:monooxygenase [Cryptococcus neoformans]|uniref:Monooxygenase n=2 Tax=Cryptococcus neoformans TaxID=5207 RepID=A0A854Q880_CRYNE|nr:monooxygenase [Cryptococcus neoformans var. grubii H99]AUB27702.1 monooxygenase [Cryptococcus neoformans var. grubii]OWT36511.1 monooxygenase [Cryptococcus neoformans var. grubii Bt1]OWZ51478.1 monooxygenase [Cryptococcus neoformans var. grubii 125.91]OXG13909.1 monooxygenase [Cryptococcus neoformans var. grubii Tu259-1]OXG35758.1 monooxygenase [Cryptococcus neoformans var. grubii Bt120]OXG92971.1 monooxygenase [Cryptococcus neoformans var. grubii A2-102-5]OXH04187.1 monooxygenase [Crypto|eukprot:XP_012052052.1 monooxygenase [Cryptococcus neoformans var. grubii H99]